MASPGSSVVGYYNWGLATRTVVRRVNISIAYATKVDMVG